MPRILVCGDREWENTEAIVRELSKLPPGTVIIEGEARGADSIARDVAIGLGFEVLRFPANWVMHGKKAGPLRNRQMADDGHPDEVWAFHANIVASKGTKDMVGYARKKGIPVKIFTE